MYPYNFSWCQELRLNILNIISRSFAIYSTVYLNLQRLESTIPEFDLEFPRFVIFTLISSAFVQRTFFNIPFIKKKKKEKNLQIRFPLKVIADNCSNIADDDDTKSNSFFLHYFKCKWMNADETRLLFEWYNHVHSQYLKIRYICVFFFLKLKIFINNYSTDKNAEKLFCL